MLPREFLLAVHSFGGFSLSVERDLALGQGCVRPGLVQTAVLEEDEAVIACTLVKASENPHAVICDSNGVSVDGRGFVTLRDGAWVQVWDGLITMGPHCAPRVCIVLCSS